MQLPCCLIGVGLVVKEMHPFPNRLYHSLYSLLWCRKFWLLHILTNRYNCFTLALTVSTHSISLWVDLRFFECEWFSCVHWQFVITLPGLSGHMYTFFKNGLLRSGILDSFYVVYISKIFSPNQWLIFSLS